MAVKPQPKGLEEGAALLGLQLREATFRAPESTKEQAARLGEEGEKGKHRRFMEKAVFSLVSLVVVLAVVGCLGVIFVPGSSAILKERAIGVLGGIVASIIAAAFGFIAGKKAGGE